MKFGFVAKHRGAWSVDMLCEALGVSRSGFYAWRTRPPSARAQIDAQILGTIRTSFALSDRTYGVTRILGGVRDVHAVAPNVLDRQFTATAPNQKWVADFTYIWTSEGWLYVAAVLDLFSRRVVGWSMHPTMTTQLVTDALPMAIWRRGATETLLHHSDQGSQYTSELFRRQLRDLGVTCSMSRSGNVWDNSVMESFFSTLKTERANRRHYPTRNAARADVFDYIERWYNQTRRHSTNGNISPIAFERAAAVA